MVGKKDKVFKTHSVLLAAEQLKHWRLIHVWTCMIAYFAKEKLYLVENQSDVQPVLFKQ
jgi:hypothetical protein